MSEEQKLKKHQDIEVKSLKNTRLKVIRQDRKNMSSANACIENENARYKVINVSNFGVLIESEEQITFDSAQFNLIIENVDMGNYNLRPVRSYTNDHGDLRTAFEVIGDIINTELIDTIFEAKSVIESHSEYISTNNLVPDRFARKVYEIKDWLEELQFNLDAIEKKNSNLDPAFKENYEHLMAQMIGEYIETFIPARNEELAAYIEGFSKEEIQACYGFFREKLKKLIYQAPFSDRVYNKPLGYAGDYEMMNIIYRSTTEGDSLFAKCLHQYWVKQPAAQAVRNRANYLVKKIREAIDTTRKGRIQFLSVACGPAMEWQMLCNEIDTDKQLFVDLLDQDEDALKSCQRNMKTINKNDQIIFDFKHQAIRNVIARGLAAEYDMIYTAGLFDYFSAPVAKMACQRLYESLKPGGKIIIGNFNVDNPNSVTMDLALDWHLIYRSSEELKELLHLPGSKITVEKEDLNINLFCIIEKP